MDPGVHAALGFGHVLRREDEAARLQFEESIRLGSQDFRPPYYLAKLAQGKPAAESEDRTRIMAWLDAALRLRPDFPGTHLALCRQYTNEPRDPVRAIQEGKAAVRLEPQNLAYQADLGMAYINLDMELQAKAMGGQLASLANTPHGKQIAASYGTMLAQYLERKTRPTAQGPTSGSDPTSPPLMTAPSPVPAIKFSLPTYYAPLGREVLQLVSEGKQEVAIRKVEMAIAVATNAYDRRALQTLLDTLRGKRAPMEEARPTAPGGG
jgi:hypothetical protein